MSQPKPKIEIQGLEEALAKLPAAERDAAREEILKVFSDPEFLDQSVEVEDLPSGTMRCPGCKGLLISFGEPCADPDGSVVEFLDCDKCDRCFARPASN